MLYPEIRITVFIILYFEDYKNPSSIIAAFKALCSLNLLLKNIRNKFYALNNTTLLKPFTLLSPVIYMSVVSYMADFVVKVIVLARYGSQFFK